MQGFVKICGIARYRDMVEVAAMKPDALGFVLYSKSPRAVTADQLAKWLPALTVPVLKVGVFVDPDPDEAAAVARRVGLDVVQIHGGGASAGAFRMAGVKVWRAVHADRMKFSDDSGSVDGYVADTYSKDLHGGTGQVGNWEAVRALVRGTRKPVLLAGGLNPGNVAEAIRAVRPWGVDVSSGVEAEPGVKDLNKVREFIQQCRKA